MIAELLLPFQLPFMQNAFLIGLIISVPTALLSCFLVLRGWALMGDAVSHGVLPGIVLAYMMGVPLIAGAFAAGMFTAVASGYLSDNSRVKPDTAMGVVFSGMFGLGIVLYVAIRPDIHLKHILFGNILGVGPEDIVTSGIISAGVALVLILKWREFLALSFDPTQARASGLAVGWLHYGLLAALSLTVVATLSAVGLILAIGLLIAPGAIAFLLVRRFSTMLWLSVVICAVAITLGTYLSLPLDTPPAPTIILILTAMFIMAFVRRIILTRRTTRHLSD